jgi:hypothetical protein
MTIGCDGVVDVAGLMNGSAEMDLMLRD